MFTNLFTKSSVCLCFCLSSKNLIFPNERDGYIYRERYRTLSPSEIHISSTRIVLSLQCHSLSFSVPSLSLSHTRALTKHTLSHSPPFLTHARQRRISHSSVLTDFQEKKPAPELLKLPMFVQRFEFQAS